jgi:1,6-anhydro-N-acetylmuramate kinase
MSGLTRAMWKLNSSPDELREEVTRLRAERGAVRTAQEAVLQRLAHAQATMRSLESARQQALTRARNMRAEAAWAAGVRRRTVVARDGTRVIFPRVVPKTRRRA